MVLKFQILKGDGPSVIPLAQLLAGEITSDRMWFVEPRDQGLAPAARARAFEGIGYLANNSPLVYTSKGNASVNFRTVDITLTQRCSSRNDPRPFYYVHQCPILPDGTLTVRLYDEAGRQLPDDVWCYEPQTQASDINPVRHNAKIYVEDPGHYKVVYSNTTGFALNEWLRLTPVMQAWPREGEAYGTNMIRLLTVDSSGERRVEGRLPVTPKTNLLTITCDTTPAYLTLTDGGSSYTLTLAETADKVTVGAITISKTQNYLLSDLKQTIERVPGWHAKLLAPRHTAVYTFGDGSATWGFLDTLTEQTLDVTLGVTITGRVVFYRTALARPFEVKLPIYAAETPWYPRVGAGHFLTTETIPQTSADLLGAALGKTVLTAVTAEWGIDPLMDSRRDEPTQSGQLMLTTSGQSKDFYGSIKGNGVLRITPVLETLRPDSEDGRRWKASSRLIKSIVECWVGQTRYRDSAALFDSVDHLEGTFITKVALEEPPRIRYYFYDDSLQLSSWRNPLTGRVIPVELNPRYQAEDQRWKSQLVVMTPTRLTVKTSQGDLWTLSNPAPLRLVPSDDPYSDERQLIGHWSTTLPAGTMGKALQLPLRALAILHCRPTFGPSLVPVTDLRRQGGDLLEELTQDLAEKLTNQTKGWDLLTSRRSWQSGQSLVIWLPASLKQRYSEAQVRERVTAVLPVATFFTIQWY